MDYDYACDRAELYEDLNPAIQARRERGWEYFAHTLSYAYLTSQEHRAAIGNLVDFGRQYILRPSGWIVWFRKPREMHGENR